MCKSIYAKGISWRFCNNVKMTVKMLKLNITHNHEFNQKIPE